MYSRLAGQPHEMKAAYGVVVIGSGYGGAITAARLAAAGHSVCLLERGKEWTPGQFPDDVTGVLGELRTDLNPLGLYDYQRGDDLDIFSGSGLGGTSLVNANVAIRPDADVFQQARWPKALQLAAERGELGAYFDRVSEMLQVEQSDQADPAKVEGLRAGGTRAAARTGARHYKLHLAANLSRLDGRANAYGVSQTLCTLCGDCVTGCNIGAKNTLYMNYLPLARQRGAEIYVQVEVSHVARCPDGGWYVHATQRQHGRDDQPCAIHAGQVVIAAGVMGSAGILLRSRDRGLALSRRLGHYFSSNADLLGVGYNNDQPTDVMGFGNHPSELRVGPTIMSVVDHRDPGRPLAERYIIEEGAFPRALIDALRRVTPVVSFQQGQDTDAGLRDWAREVGRIMRDLAGRDAKGALNSSMLYLGIGHDTADGHIILDPAGRPKIVWGAVPDLPIFETISQQMYDITAALGGTYIRNPRWSKWFGHNAVTVHPLGGVPMGDDADRGVVDDLGRVHDPEGGLHDGLHVVDGSIVPTSLGVNPFLTISALAERIADRMVAAHKAPLAPRAAMVAVPAPVPPPVGLEFTEEMKGHFTTSVTGARTEAEYRRAEAIGRGEGSFINFRLTILIDDVDRFIRDRAHDAVAVGHVSSQALGAKRDVDDGRFNLFLDDDARGTRRMLYRLKFYGEDGQPYLLDGYKEIRDDPGLDVWADNTTLFSTIRRGWSLDGPVLGQGIIHVKVADFLEQLTTFRARNSPSALTSAGYLEHFGEFFFGSLWQVYISHHVRSGATGTPAE